MKSENGSAQAAADNAAKLILRALAVLAIAAECFLIKWLGVLYGLGALLTLIAIFFLLLACHTMREAKRKISTAENSCPANRRDSAVMEEK